MNLTPRNISLFAAGFAAALWIAAPAMAAEADASGKQAAGVASVKTVSTKRHHIWPRYRVASWYTSRLRYADATPVGWRGGGYWHSRPPVLLIIGIYY